MSSIWDELGWTDPDRRNEAIDRILNDMAHAPKPNTNLTPAELRVVYCLSYGLGSRGAAEMCNITYETARDHSKHARRKLRARDTTHLIAIAIRRGLIP